jgi:hypothetical protein
MSAPYETKPDVLAPQVGAAVHEIDWPHRSVISKILVARKDGAGQFTVELFNYPIDTLPVSDSVGGEGEVGKVPEDLYRVTPPITSTDSVNVRYFSEESTGGYGYVFFSHELRADRQGQRANKLYLRITPAGGGTHRFAVCVGGMKEIE